MKKVFILTAVAAVSLMAADPAATFKQKCASCHGQKAEKKALGKSDVIAGWDAATVVAALKEYKAGTRNKHGMLPAKKGVTAPLTDEMMEAAAAFVASQK